MSCQMSCLIGNCHPEFDNTIAATLDHIPSGMLCPPVIEFADKLVSLLPTGLEKVVFLSTFG